MDAAAHLGVSVEYVTELMLEEEFAAEVRTARGAMAVSDVSHDETIDGGEEAALKRLVQLLPMSTKISEVTRAFSVLNAARRRLGPESAAPSATGVVVDIELPANSATAIRVQLSAQNHVLSVDARSMVTLPAQSLQQRLAARQETRLLSTVDVAPPARNKLLDKL